jgi:glycosyltransferase involved in cell wall biosynthesis
MGFYFFPRGGSAQVARYLCRALAVGRWSPTLFAGSLGAAAEASNSGRFFREIRCRSLDYSPARARWLAGRDPMSGRVPMHASYEAKPDVPDKVFVDLDDAAFDRQVCSWVHFLSQNAAAPPSVVHLHHLTPMHEAVRTLWPQVPVVTHLHGTELKMLAAVREGALAGASGRFAAEWEARMLRWARESERLVVVSDQDHQLAVDLLHVDPNRLSTIGNGVDTEVFVPRARPLAERLARWRRWLVDDPKGWRPDAAEGSISYRPSDLAAFTDDEGRAVPVILFVGRFMQFKRLQLLIEAHHTMRVRSGLRSVLVIVGGFPGEWEGEHPYDTVQRLGAQDVFFIGWLDHSELSEVLGCVDVFAAPSVDEPFGLVYLEAMSAGLPAIATATGGPLSFINVEPGRPTGWLVPPDDVEATAAALTEAVGDPAGRAARGARAARFVRERYSWAQSAASFADLYQEVVDDACAGRTLQAGSTSSGVA